MHTHPHTHTCHACHDSDSCRHARYHRKRQCVAVCCSVLRCVAVFAVCCRCVAVCCHDSNWYIHEGYHWKQPLTHTSTRTHTHTHTHTHTLTRAHTHTHTRTRTRTCTHTHTHTHTHMHAYTHTSKKTNIHTQHTQKRTHTHRGLFCRALLQKRPTIH